MVFLESASKAPNANETSFSRNYVSLEISGRELVDLAFVDLPGLIASVGQAGHESDIELVKNLVTSYIEKPSCVIMLTIACETDFENQGAHHLAKQYDPEGNRTVGVLTKPDRIPLGEEDSWLQLIRNEVEPLLNNWYCVKQPSSLTLSQGITWAEARRQENEFFATNKPWCNLDAHYQLFLRTDKLTERLSTILAELIAKRLPEIQDELYLVVHETEQELASLPTKPSNDPVGEVLRVLRNFTTELAQHIEGTPDENGLIQIIRPYTDKFKREIRATAPEFRPWNRSDDRRRKLPPLNFLSGEEKAIDSDNDNDMLTVNSRMIVHDHLDIAAAYTKERIEWLLAVEGSPATLNTHYFSDYRDKFLAYYKGCRKNSDGTYRVWRLPVERPNELNKAVSSLAEIGFNVKPEDLIKLSPSDPMEPAIGIMASVRGYFQVAYKRFVDMVPMAIDYEIVRGLERGLDEALRNGLRLTGQDAHERCAALLQEPVGVTSRRHEVLKKLERLRDARKELSRLSV
ncbi:hypothetical protein ID866_10924 [Astraeus odoratus]|nr:hypothetical protein ID866_10924 [Astraeus odoratus]